ncbi:MAG: hypothetical protein ACAH59_12265 [Pseudobdellovibrionaceae bacterium]
MFKRFEVLFLFLIQCTPQAMTAWAAPENSQGQEQKVPASRGDIDMNQFQDVPTPGKRQTTNLIPQKTVCIDAQNNMIKKGEPGFETCLSNSQSRVLKPNSIPEAPDDGREF